jgi:hypothetical protein
MGWFPYIPRQRNDQGADNITRLIMEQGRIAGDRAHNQGQIISGAVRGLGQIASGAVEQHQLKKRDKAATAIIDGWDGNDPGILLQGLTRVYGPQDGPRVAQSVVEFRRAAGTGDDMDLPGVQAYAGFLADQDDAMVENQWGSWLSKAGPLLMKKVGIPPEAFQQPVTSEQKRQLLQAISGKAKAAPKTREVTTTNPDGSKTTRIVEDKPGQEWHSAAEPPKPPNLQHVETAAGIQTFNPQTGEMGPVIAKGKPAQGVSPDFEWVIRNGEHVQIRKGTAQRGDSPASVRERGPTGAERTALAFFNDARQAANDADAVADKVGNGFRLKYAPNIAQSSEQQQYWQAIRSFTEARLRKRSGAAIPEYEIEKDAKMYFKQPGDGDAVTAQKKASRERVLDGIRLESGKAYDEYYGEPAPKPRDKQADPLGLR